MRREYQLALLSGKKTLLRVKPPLFRFLCKPHIQHVEESDDFERLYISVPFEKKMKDYSYFLVGEGWFHKDLFGNKAKESDKPSDGNVVIGYSTQNYLILDIDFHTEKQVLEFSDMYARTQDLGSYLIMKTSDGYLNDLEGNKLGKYCIVFGTPMTNEEQRWHIREVYRLGMVERAFLAMTSYRFITERTNPKNYKIRAPIILKFVANGDMRGIKDYVRWYNLSHKLGLFQEK